MEGRRADFSKKTDAADVSNRVLKKASEVVE
jgi:hypothetical protein